jgi:uncharacterized protein
MNAQISVSGPLSGAELDQLSDFLAASTTRRRWRWKAWTVYSARSLQDLRPCYPEGLPVIWGGELPTENAFPSVEAANAMLSLIVRHWNSIITELETDGEHIPLVFEVEAGAVTGREWSRGFMCGVDFARSGWNELRR